MDTEIDVQHIAKLAMLKFTDEEAAAFKSEFGVILKMVENLPEIPSDLALTDVSNQMTLREDEIIPSYPRDEMLENVPHAAAGCIVVPKTVE